MAIDKNSKAYQALLNKGYSDDQISQMYNTASERGTTKGVTETVTPVNTPTPSGGPADGYANATERNMATGGAEFGNTQTATPIKQETEVKQPQTQGSTVPEIKQEGALKPKSQEYYNQTSQEAQNQIVANLNGYRQTNPEFFSDYESFKKNFSYDARNEEQKRTLDTWYGGYQKGMQLAGLPTTDLYTQYKDGQVSASELENLRVYSPEKYAELQSQINKGNIVAAYDDDKGMDTTPKSIQEMAYDMAVQTFNQFMSGDTSSGASNIFREYEDKMNDPEMLALSDKTTEIQEEIENIQADLDTIKKSVEEEYAGTGATRSKINAIISDRSYDLQLQLRTLNSEYNKYATQYNNRMNQYQTEFGMQIQEYQLAQQERTQKMNELGFAMDLMNFETNDQKAQREWDYWVKQQEYTNGNINSKDYQTRYKAALKSVENLLAQYPGIPTQRSAEQMADDILKAIDNGSNLGAELTKINKFMQEKPEYRYLYNNTYGTTDKGIEGTYNIGGTEYVMYNGQLMTSDDFNKQHGGGSKANYTVVSPDVFKTYSDGRAGTFGSFMAKSQNNDGNYVGQCGKFVNNYLQEIGAGRLFGKETIDVRKGWVNSDEGKVGTVALFDYNHYTDGKNYGHVGIVISAPDKNGDFWVKDANFDTKNPGVIMTRKVNLKDASLKGFIDPSLDQNGNRVSAGTPATLTTNGTTTNGNITSNGTTVGGMSKAYEPTRVGLYDKYLNEGTAPTDAKLKAIGGGDLDKGWQIFDAEVADYMEKTGAGSLDKKKNDEVNKLRTEMHQNQKFTDYNQMQTYFQKIKDNTNNETATAASDVALLFNFMKMLDPKSIVRESEFKTAQNMGSLPQARHASLKSAVNGKKLTDKQRTQIYEEAAGLMDGATYLYNELLDDYSSMISYGGDASRLGKKGVYYTDEYKNQYGTSNTQSTPQVKNFFTLYANTAQGVGKRRPYGSNNQGNVQLSNGQSFYWNS